MIIDHLISIVLAYLIDRIVGDPKSLPHPVRMIGKGIACLEQRLNFGKFRRLKGSLVVFLLVIVVIAITVLIMYFSYRMNRTFGIVIESSLIATTIATKGLADAANDVYEPLIEGDIEKARKNLSLIVARDTEQLTEAEITRATVETVAENTSDGITAPLFWALIGGAPLALAYRTINTCDSMLGYKNEQFAQFGWASARLDDVVNYIPSRLTGLWMIIVNQPVQPRSRRDCFRIFTRDAKKHASPNSGWLESATAALLGIQLGGTNIYAGIVSKRAYIGESIYPLEAKHIAQAVSIMHRTTNTMLILFLLGGGLIVSTCSWLESAVSF